MASTAATAEDPLLVDRSPSANHAGGNSPDACQERCLSAEILSLIEEAFPVPTFSIEWPDSSSPDQHGDPPAYNASHEPPRHASSLQGTLKDRLAAPYMAEAFSFRLRFKRMSMELPRPDAAIEIFSDLALLSPAMPFDLFLRQIQSTTREHFLATRPPGKSIPPGECMTHVFCVVFRERPPGLLRRVKKVKLIISPQNWAATVSSLREGRASEIQVTFWTGMPGSWAQRDRAGEGGMQSTTQRVLRSCVTLRS